MLYGSLLPSIFTSTTLVGVYLCKIVLLEVNHEQEHGRPIRALVHYCECCSNSYTPVLPRFDDLDRVQSGVSGPDNTRPNNT